MEWNTCDSIFRCENVAIEAVRIERQDNGGYITIIWARCNNSIMRHQHISKPFSTLENAKLWAFSFLEKYSACLECGAIDAHASSRACASCEFFIEYVRYKNIEPTTCAICQEHVYRFTLPCGHMFHKTCMNKMEHGTCRTCPVCRAEIPYSVVCRIFDQEDEGDDLFPDKDDDEA